MGKEYTDTFILKTYLIFQSAKSFGKLRLRAFQPYPPILCILKHVEDVKDGKRTHRHIFLNTIFDILTYIHCFDLLYNISHMH